MCRGAGEWIVTRVRIAFAAFSLIIAALLPGRARSQVSAYVTFAPAHLSGVRDGNGTNTTSFWAPGVGGGVSLTVLPLGPVKLGLDLRGSTKPGTNGADTVMGGVKLGLNLPLVRFKPYVQASGGYLGTRTRAASGHTESDQFAAYEVLGGVDYPLVPFFDWRVIEVGGGRGYNIGSVTSAGNYQVTLFTVNTGLVFHF